MRIGVPRETKIMEYRVGMVPDAVTSLRRSGHEIWVDLTVAPVRLAVLTISRVEWSSTR